MGNLKSALFLGLGVVLLPGLVLAGQGATGACFFVGDVADVFEDPSSGNGKFSVAACADGLTEDECTSVSILTEFWEGATCEDVADKGSIMWDGSCQADIPPLGDLCVVLWTEFGVTATQGLCENDLGGTWYLDLECGAAVPAMPPIGLGVMAMLILGGALLLLTLRSSLPSA